jgi:hypothetical protein
VREVVDGESLFPFGLWWGMFVVNVVVDDVMASGLLELSSWPTTSTSSHRHRLVYCYNWLRRCA